MTDTRDSIPIPLFTFMTWDSARDLTLDKILQARTSKLFLAGRPEMGD